MKKIVAIGVLVFTTSLMVQAAPNINIGTMYDYLDGTKSTLLKRVRNAGDSTAFVKVSVAEIVYDAVGNASEAPVNPVVSTGDQATTLVASPARLIVPANGMQATRLLYMGARDTERYFRVRFAPVLPEKNDDFEVGESEAQAYKESLSAGVNVLAGYGGIVFVRPANTRYATEVIKESSSFKVSNNGNASIVLDHFKACPSKGTKCDVPTKHHVLPQSSREFKKEVGRTYHFELIEGDQTKKIDIDE